MPRADSAASTAPGTVQLNRSAHCGAYRCARSTSSESMISARDEAPWARTAAAGRRAIRRETPRGRGAAASEKLVARFSIQSILAGVMKQPRLSPCAAGSPVTCTAHTRACRSLPLPVSVYTGEPLAPISDRIG